MRLNRSLRAVAAPAAAEGVTTLELFFDLVFVYTITQVTSVVRADRLLPALGILVLTWWMYDGYCWLSNNVGPTTLETRLPMLVAMAGFLVMAIATPDAYHSGAWPFAIAFVTVVLVHGIQFARSSVGSSAQAILQVLPLNLAMALGLVLAAILAPHDDAWIGWLVAFAVLVVAVFRVRGKGFTVRAEHFAERHQLLIIIALGETVVATGAGAQGRLEHGPVLLAVLLSMVLLAALWWVYFGGADQRGAEALAGAPAARRSDLAFWGYSVGHLIHVLGLVLVAAGLHDVIIAPTYHLAVRPASSLACGAAIFLLAEAWFRRFLDIGSRSALVVGAAACVVVAAVGHHLEGVVELELLATLLIAVLVAQPRTGEPAPPARPAAEASGRAGDGP
jgi:low temperature requirement protein LtrA